MFRETPEGQTHSYNDGCGMKEHNDEIVLKPLLHEVLQQIVDAPRSDAHNLARRILESLKTQ